jgi:hypothetical protein
MTLGEMFRTLRLRLPHYRELRKFSKELSCSMSHYRSIENGKRPPSRLLMEEIDTALEPTREQRTALWTAWALEKIPEDVQRDVLPVYFLDAECFSSEVSAQVLGELRKLYSLGKEDEDEIRAVIAAVTQLEDVRE